MSEVRNSGTAVWLGRISRLSFSSGLFAFIFGNEYELDWLISLALVFAAIALIAGAIEVHLLRRGETPGGIGSWHIDWGQALYPLSLTMLIAGFALLTLGLLRLIGWEQTFSDYIARRPGIAIFASGVSLIGLGTAITIGRKSWRDSRWDMIIYFPARLVGLALLLSGVLCVVISAIEMVMPSVFDRWLDAALGSLNPFPRTPGR